MLPSPHSEPHTASLSPEASSSSSSSHASPPTASGGSDAGVSGSTAVLVPRKRRVAHSPSRPLSFCSSIWSDICSLTRSSSSRSGTRTSTSSRKTTDSSLNDPLSKLSTPEFLSHIKETPPKLDPTKMSSAFRRTRKTPKAGPANPTTAELAATLVETCCKKRFAGRDAPGCVHQRLQNAITAQRGRGRPYEEFLRNPLTDDEVSTVDKFGNTLLHWAALWGARVSILHMLLRRTEDIFGSITAVNKRGETFLHLFDPPADPEFGPGCFAKLVRYLQSRGFDFCKRDADKRVFLHALVRRREFPIEALHALFKEVSFASARFLVAKRSVDGERLWHFVVQGLEGRRKHLSSVFGDEMGFVHRYLPEFRHAGPDGDIVVDSPRYGLTPDTTDGSPPPPPKTKGRDPVTGRTALMRLLLDIGVSGRKHREEDLRRAMERHCKADHEALRSCDKEGNTALHYAAEFGIVFAVAFLCDKGAKVNSWNNCGNTPLRLVKYAMQRTDIRRDMHMESRYLRCAGTLLEHRAVDHLAVPPKTQNIQMNDGIWDGSERTIEGLMQIGAARQCKGLHLLSPGAASCSSHAAAMMGSPESGSGGPAFADLPPWETSPLQIGGMMEESEVLRSPTAVVAASGSRSPGVDNQHVKVII
jgi:ankyrin repeat protein